MKRFVYGSLAALGLALSASPVLADVAFEYSCSRHIGYTRTSKNRCFSFNSHANPLGCPGSSCSSASGPSLWNAMPAYAAPVHAAPAPTFQAPAPAPAKPAVQQAGYNYYAPTYAPTYDYSGGYNYYMNYGYYGYGAGYAQAPNYWY